MTLAFVSQAVSSGLHRAGSVAAAPDRSRSSVLGRKLVVTGRQALAHYSPRCSAVDTNAPADERDLKRDARRADLRDLSRVSGLPSFSSRVPAEFSPLARRAAPSTLQINIGLTCNLACRHCHVESSPSRAETMTREVADRLIALTKADAHITTVDITGGAPELHEQFRHLVTSFRAMGLRVIDRCNLTVMSLPGQEDLADFLADNEVQVVASLPCYSTENVEKQRGDGVFDASILALQSLNARGYGKDGSGLELSLVYNPLGPTLPPPQQSLEGDYRRELARAFDISFTRLICITNMPIKRFADDLRRTGTLEQYMHLLANSFNANTVSSVMCRDQIHVAYDGRLYDCDFNYALGLPAQSNTITQSSIVDVFSIESWADLSASKIKTGPHCFGCTAGSGSSCGGSLEDS